MKIHLSIQFPGHNSFLLILLLCLIAPVVLFNGCKKEPSLETFYTEDELLISSWLKDHSEDYSTLLDVLDITGTQSILDAYGHYTFFAPDNNAFNEFCLANGKTTINEFSKEFLTTLVKFHLLNKDVVTNFLPNGVLADTNYTGDNLVFSFSEGGLNAITINNEATIIQRDIKVANGHINRLNKVLTPVFLSAYDWIAASGNCGIFAQALLLTGLKDTLGMIYIEKTGKRFMKNRFSLFVEPDEVFHVAGITTAEELRQRYSTTGNPKDPTDGFYRFMAYHCFPGIYYLNQLDSFNYPTLALNKLISITPGDEILLNRHLKGDSILAVKINRDISNQSVKNGVIHFIGSILEEYEPAPAYFVFDFCSYQGISIGSRYSVEDIMDIDGIETENSGLWYRMSMLEEDSSYLETTVSKVGWIVRFEIPPIEKGKYRVVLHWVSTQDRSSVVQAFWDGEMLGQEFSMIRSKRPPMVPPEWLYDFHFDEEIGKVNLDVTSSHTMSFVGLAEGYGDFDYVAFWPVQ
jgi:uncharacterized surface protein with fasciclin (FAS1) repeats